MGAISFTIDRTLVRELQQQLGLTHFVETGTFRGESLAAVHGLFAHCLSIELSPEYHAAAARRFAHVPNVTVLLGDSPAVLAAQRASYAGQPTLFWLDAHWCAAENTAGEISQCPLLAELASIGPLNAGSAILIDDARLFLGPPPKPHEISSWPDLDSLLRQLHQLSDRHAVVCFNDVIAFVPTATLPRLRPFLHEHAVNLLTLADKARDYDSVLAQVKEKDGENETLLAEASGKDQEIKSLLDTNNSLLTEVKAKDQEIKSLLVVAEERQVVIQKLDLGVTQYRRALAELGRDPAQASPDLTALMDEVASLRVQLNSARSQVQNKQIQLSKLELEAARVPRKARLGLWRRWLVRWQTHLTQTTPHPLAKLRQYPPRPLRLEKFPRPANRKKWPRICVITPSYQHARFLERTMLSVLDQNYPNLAYGVQDGGSTDGSAEIITRHLPRLAHAESARDRGQSDAIRRGFAKLYPESGDIMAWLNSDDLLMPGALHYVGDYFARHPEVDVVYGHRVVIDEDDQEIGRWFLPPYHRGTLKWFDLVPQETLFWRARCYQDIGGLDEAFHFALDWDLLLRFEQAGAVIHRLPRFLGCFRAHAEQKTSALIKTVGEEEMRQLRRRVHEREVPSNEVHRHLTEEINRSAWVEWLHRYGWRR